MQVGNDTVKIDSMRQIFVINSHDSLSDDSLLHDSLLENCVYQSWCLLMNQTLKNTASSFSPSFLVAHDRDCL
jgi:hypothetical protein